MKNTIIILAALFTFLSCDSFGLEKSLENKVTFEVDRLNSDSNYSSEVESYELIQEFETWYGNPDLAVNLRKQFDFSVKLKNGEEVKIGVNMRKDGIPIHELESVVLEEDGSKKWDFATTSEAIDIFYNTLDYIEFTIDNKVIFFEAPFDRVKVEASSNNEGDDSFVVLDLRFSETAFGWFDPLGQWDVYYDIKNAEIELIMRE